MSRIYIRGFAALACLLAGGTALAQRAEFLPASAWKQTIHVGPRPTPPPAGRRTWPQPRLPMPHADGTTLPHPKTDEDDDSEDTRHLIEQWNARPSPQQFARVTKAARSIHREARPGAWSFSPVANQWTQEVTGIQSADGVHHRAGRMRAATYAYDNVQNATVLWLGATGGGLWKAVFFGLFPVWVPVSDSLPGSPSVGAFLLQPGNSKNILIGTGDLYRYAGSGLYKSTDSGATWSLKSPNASSFEKIIADAGDPTGNTVLAQGDSGIWRSTDFGDTWKQVYSGQATDLVQDAVDTNIWIVGVPGIGTYRSTDGGLNFPTSSNPADGDISTGITGSIGRISLTECASQPQYVYALTSGSGKEFGNLTGIWRSSNYGATFTAIEITDVISGAKQGFHTCAIGVDPTNPDLLFAGMTDMQWTKTATKASPTWFHGSDGGHPDYTGFLFEPKTTTVIITNDGGYYAYDYASDTVNGNGNLYGLACEQETGQNGFLGTSYSKPDLNLAGLQDNGTAWFNTTQSPYMNISLGGDGGQVSIDPDDPTVLASSLNHQRFYSSDSAADWNSVTASLVADWVPSMLVDPMPNRVSPNILTYAQILVNGVNGGKPQYLGTGVYAKPIETTLDWQAVGNWLPNNCTANQVDGSTNPLLYCYYVSTSNGKMYVYEGNALGTLPFYDRTPPLPAFSSANDCRINADKSTLQPNTVYYVTAGATPSTAFLSTDRGQHWQNVTAGAANLTGISYYKLLANPSDLTQLYLATSIGVFRSDNGGTNWYPFMTGMPAVASINDMTLSYDNAKPPVLRVGTYGRGFWYRQIVADAAIKKVGFPQIGGIGGLIASATIVLNKPAGPNGATIILRSSSDFLRPPSSITVPAGATQSVFPVRTAAVNVPTTVTLFASYHGQIVSTSLTLAPVGLASIAASPNPVAGGLTATGQITLNAPAGPGPLTVALASQNSAIANPASPSIVIPAGATTGLFPITTTPVAAITPVTLSATLHTSSAKTVLNVRPIGVKSISLARSTVIAGQSVTGTVTLELPAAPGPITVTITSSDGSVATVSPSMITVPAGAQTAAFTVQTRRGRASTTVTLSATANGITVSTRLVVNQG